MSLWARELTSPELAYLDSEEQHSELFLWVLDPYLVWEGQVNTPLPTTNDEVPSINVDNTSWGSGYTSAKNDMLILVGSAQYGFDKGIVRLRTGFSGTVTSLAIGEISEIEWEENDYVTIVDEIALAPRHPRLTEDNYYMDYDIDYTDEHTYPPPVPVLGVTLSPVWLEGASVAVPSDASASWALDGGALSYSWSFPGASSSTGDLTATPTAYYNQAGQYRMDCVVTRDYGGGHVKTSEGSRYVVVFDENNMPYTAFTLDECGGSRDEQGWRFRITMHADAEQSKIRERALCVLFAKDWYGNTEVSIGPITNRENIISIGWIGNETINWDIEAGSVSFDVEGPHYWLSQMNGFPLGVADVQPGMDLYPVDDWTKWEDLSVRDAVWHFIYYGTTITRLLDYVQLSAIIYTALFNASKGTLWAQITDESKALMMLHPCCDRFGRVAIQREPQVGTEAQKAAWPVVQEITGDDVIRPVVFERRTVPTTGQIDLSGIYYQEGVAEPMFSLAPGHIAKWIGQQVETLDRQQLQGQVYSNELAGLILGWRNVIYPRVPIRFGSNHRMFSIIGYNKAELNLAAGDTLRNIAISLTLIPQAIRFTYDHNTGFLGTEIEFEQGSVEERNADGDIPPSPALPGTPPREPPPGPPPVEEVPAEEVYIFTKTLGVYFTDYFGKATATEPLWIDDNTDLPATTLKMGVVDPFQGDYYQYCLLTNGDIHSRYIEDGLEWVLSLDLGNYTTDPSARFILGEWLADNGKTASDADNADVYHILVDTKSPGHIYAHIGYYNNADTDDVGWHLLYSPDYGENWFHFCEIIEYDDDSRYTLPWKRGNYIWAGTEEYSVEGPGSRPSVYYASMNRGGVWVSAVVPKDPSGYGVGYPKISVSEFRPEIAYYSTYSGTKYQHWELEITDTPSLGVTETYINDDRGQEFGDQMYFSYLTDDTQWGLFTHETAENSYLTLDDWANDEGGAHSPQLRGYAQATQWTEDLLYAHTSLSGTDHVVVAMQGLVNFQTGGIEKAGPDPVTPDSDSIPNTCGGACENGVQPVVYRMPNLPEEIWVGTIYEGVWRTLNFSNFDHVTGAQPKWGPVNEGLGNLTSIFTLHLDPFNESGRQYACVGDPEDDWEWSKYRGPIVRREEPNDWEIILSFSDVNTLTSQIDCEIFDGCLDPENEDYVFAIALSEDSKSMYLLRSTDGGDVWALHDTVVTWPHFFYGVGFDDCAIRWRVLAKGDEVLISGEHFYDDGAENETCASWYSVNGGTTWTLCETSTWWADYHSGITIGPDYPFFNGYDGGLTLSRYETVDPTWWTAQQYNYMPFESIVDFPPSGGVVYLGDKQLWIDPNDSDHMIYSFRSYTFETFDAWDTCMGVIKADSQQSEIWVSELDGVSMVLTTGRVGGGTYEEHIHVSFDQGQTLYGASGPTPLEDPYIDSIPEAAGGIAYSCFRVVEPT